MQSSYRYIQNENVLLFLSFVVMVLVSIAFMGNEHHANMWMQCCGKGFWWSPRGCALLLLGSSLLLRLRIPRVYPIVILLSFFALISSSYITLERWNDYSLIDKGYAFQQAVLPIYRPLSIVISIFILSITVKKIMDTLKSSHLK